MGVDMHGNKIFSNSISGTHHRLKDLIPLSLVMENPQTMIKSVYLPKQMPAHTEPPS